MAQRETMAAVVLRGPRDMALMEVPRPELTAPEHVLVEVKACGICGSDLRYWAGENPWALHTLGEEVAPATNIILGHELAGVVVEVNDERYEGLLGRRVGVQAFRTCGVCDLCRSGHENLCRDTQHIGHAQGWGEMAYYPGGYAEYCLAWADLLHPMADHVAFEEEVLRDPLGVAVHAVGRSRLPEGGTVLCIGGGPVGLLTAQVARAKGAGQVFISEPSPTARRVIDHYADFTCIDPTEELVNEVVGRATCDAVFDTVGSATTIREALPLLAETGAYVNVAVHDIAFTMNAMDLASERLMTSSANALYQDEREAHDLLASGDVVVELMITHRLPLSEFAQAYDLLLAQPKQAYKVVFV